MASFGDIISIGFRIISNREDILKLWDKILPMIKQATSTYSDIRALVDKIAPGVMDQVQAAATDPLTSGDGGTFSAQWLQESLNKLMDAGLAVDGDIGPATMEAVRKFQTREGLPADGWAGAGTSARILQRLEELGK